MKEIRILDLFSGMGGMKIGFENAAIKNGYNVKTIAFSDIKKSAKKILNLNFPEIKIIDDITKKDEKEIEDFDFLLAGFPCQAFSTAGKRAGFEDTRGTLFFDIARILKEKKPSGFLLENVEGLVSHNKKNKKDKIGETFRTILEVLESLNYKVSWTLINSKDIGTPQERKRVYILGLKNETPSLEYKKRNEVFNKDILESGLKVDNSPFIKKLLKKFKINDLYGKSIKDKRGGKNNIHSWDFDLKGKVNSRQKKLLNKILLERRKKHWAEKKGISWMDGMPLSIDEIKTFISYKELKNDLLKLIKIGYLKKEYPKKIVFNKNKKIYERVQDKTKKIGYNIVTGKLSFEISKILDPNGYCPTLLATDMNKIFVIDNKSSGIRKLSVKESLKMFGFPENYKTEGLSEKELLDLIGNTVVVPVIEEMSNNLIKSLDV